MKYTTEITNKMVADYNNEVSVADIAAELDVPERSVIAKLSSMGVYKKKQYLTKRGEVPIKKEEYIERIGKLLEVNLDMLESLEKVNKSVLALLEKRLVIAHQGVQ
jgi:Zn-dependent peptidase ImmA (M78 family)